jgi:hypothetical protein
MVLVAIRICLEMALHAALDPSSVGREPELADQADSQQMAFDVVEDLLGFHSVEIARRKFVNEKPDYIVC